MDAERKAWRRTVWLAAAVLLFGFLGVGWGLWWRWQRTELVFNTIADLFEAEDDLEGWKIAEAHKAMERAEGRMAGGGPAHLLQRVERMRTALSLVMLLEDIRLKGAALVEDKFAPDAMAVWDYATLFAKAGLAVEGEDAEVVAVRIRDSVIKAQLVAALDAWASMTDNPARRAWLLEVARRAQPDEWSDRFRDPALWEKPAALEQLAKEANVAELSPQLLAALGMALRRTKANAVPFLTAAQERHPNDFWLNSLMGDALLESNLEGAVGYYRAALAVQPGRSTLHNNLGLALKARGRLEDAIKEYRRAIDLNPKLASARQNLGAALADKGRLDEAIKEIQRAVDVNPKDARAHYNLGRALQAKGLLDDAMAEYRHAIALDPKHPPAHTNLAAALDAKGRWDEAIKECHRAITLDPKDASAHTNLGSALQAKGRLDDAIEEYQRAIALDPKLSLAHGALGEALLQQGRFAQARAATRHCLELLPTNDAYRQSVDRQLQHCEQLLALDEKLPAILKGEAKPIDSDERIRFAWLCQQHKHLYAASARLYTDAFADDPRLAEALGEGIRYDAACAASLAGCGKGKDAGHLPDKERARLRKQALDWLRADLTAWTKVMDKGPPQARQNVVPTLQNWQNNSDLAGLRDKEAVDKLPEAERDACQKLWADVAALLKRTQEK
jgi:tetratricopeptide (TPR) repeat protein